MLFVVVFFVFVFLFFVVVFCFIVVVSVISNNGWNWLWHF